MEVRRDRLLLSCLTYFLVGLSVVLVYSFADNDYFMFSEVFREIRMYVDFPHYYTRQLIVFWGFIASLAFIFIGVFNKLVCVAMAWMVSLSYLYITIKVKDYGSTEFGVDMLRIIAVISMLSHMFQNCFIFSIFEEQDGLPERMLSFTGGYFLGYPVITRLVLRRVLTDWSMEWDVSMADNGKMEDLFHFCITLFFLSFTMATCLTYLFYERLNEDSLRWFPGFSVPLDNRIGLGTCVYIWLLNPICISVLPYTLMEHSEYHDNVFIQRVSFALVLLVIPAILRYMDVSCLATLWSTSMASQLTRHLDRMEPIMVSDGLNGSAWNDHGGNQNEAKGKWANEGAIATSLPGNLHTFESPMAIFSSQSKIRIPHHIDTWSLMDSDEFSDWELQDVKTRDSILSAIGTLDLLIKLENTMEAEMVDEIVRYYNCDGTSDVLTTLKVLIMENKQTLLTILSQSLSISNGLTEGVGKINRCYTSNITTNCCFKTKFNGEPCNGNCECCCPFSFASIINFVHDSIAVTEGEMCAMMKMVGEDIMLNRLESYTSAKDLMRECMPVLKAYYQSCLWLLFSLVSIEETIMLTRWFCRMCEMGETICKFIKAMNCICPRKSEDGMVITVTDHSVGTLDGSDCLCTISCTGVMDGIMAIMMRMHVIRMKLVARANTSCRMEKVKTSELAHEAYILDSIKASILITSGLERVYSMVKKMCGGKCPCHYKDKNAHYPSILSCLVICCRLIRRLLADNSHGTKVLEDTLVWYKCIPMNDDEDKKGENCAVNIPTKDGKRTEEKRCGGELSIKSKNIKRSLSSYLSFIDSRKMVLSHSYTMRTEDSTEHSMYFKLSLDRTNKMMDYLSGIVTSKNGDYAFGSYTSFLKNGGKSLATSRDTVATHSSKAITVETEASEQTTSACKCCNGDGTETCEGCNQGGEGCKCSECTCECPRTSNSCTCHQTQTGTNNIAPIFTKIAETIGCKCGQDPNCGCFTNFCKSISGLRNKIDEVCKPTKEREPCKHPDKCNETCCQTARFTKFLSSYIDKVKENSTTTKHKYSCRCCRKGNKCLDDDSICGMSALFTRWFSARYCRCTLNVPKGRPCRIKMVTVKTPLKQKGVPVISKHLRIEKGGTDLCKCQLDILRKVYKELVGETGSRRKCSPCCNKEPLRCKCKCGDEEGKVECECRCKSAGFNNYNFSGDTSGCKYDCSCETCWRNFFRCYVMCGLKCEESSCKACQRTGEKGCCKCCCAQEKHIVCGCLLREHNNAHKCYTCTACLFCLYTRRMFFCDACSNGTPKSPSACSTVSTMPSASTPLTCACNCEPGTKCCCTTPASGQDYPSLKLGCCCGDRLGCSIDKLNGLMNVLKSELPCLVCIAGKLDCELFVFCDKLCNVTETLEGVRNVLESARTAVACRTDRVKCMTKCYSAKFAALKDEIQKISDTDETYPEVVKLVKKTGKFALLMASYSPEIEATYLKIGFHDQLLKGTTMNLAELANRVRSVRRLTASAGHARVASLTNSKVVRMGYYGLLPAKAFGRRVASMDAPSRETKENSSVLKDYIFVLCRILFIMLRCALVDLDNPWFVRTLTIVFSIISAIYLNLLLIELSNGLDKNAGYMVNFILLFGVGTSFVYSWILHLFDYITIVYSFGGVVSKLETSNLSVDFKRSQYSILITLLSSLKSDFWSIFAIFSGSHTSSYSSLRRSIYPFNRMDREMLISKDVVDITPILVGVDRSVSAIMDHLSFIILGSHSDVLTHSSGYFGELTREMLWYSWYTNTVITDSSLFCHYLRRSILVEMNERVRRRPVYRPFSRGFLNSRRLWRHFGKLEFNYSFYSSLKSPPVEIPKSRRQLSMLRNKLAQEYRQKWLVYQFRAVKSLVNLPLQNGPNGHSEDLPFLYMKELNGVKRMSLDDYHDIYRGTSIGTCQSLEKEIAEWHDRKLAFCDGLSDESRVAVDGAVKSLDSFIKSCKDGKPVKDLIDHMTIMDTHSAFSENGRLPGEDRKKALFHLTFNHSGLENNSRIFKGFKNAVSTTLDNQLEISRRNREIALIPLGIYTLHYGLQISSLTLEQIKNGLY